MNHFRAKINLSRLAGAVTANADLEGLGAETRCIVIPLAESHLIEDAEGVWLDVAGVRIQGNPFEQTHIIKQQMSKDVLERMSPGEKRSLPVLGGVKPFNPKKDFVAPEVMNVRIVVDGVKY